ncbi:MAG: glutamate-5-semialdehyde dehydrogenase [Myxococcota bacterium]|nr:glutamate-5-semialdehyde dehydrogenase [Myxococcota bacterium]
MSNSSIEEQIIDIAKRARAAGDRMAELGTGDKNRFLARVAERLETAKPRILEANARDIEEATEKGIETPLVNRLAISDSKWADMLQGIHDVIALDDPVGEVSDMKVRPNGMRIGRMRIPLGVIGIIYESRPNVTVDAAVLCVKAGNAVILRGGSEAIHSNLALGEELRAAAKDSGLPEDAVAIVPMTDRAAIDVLLHQDRYVDLMIPRGGPGLIRHVTAESRIPVIKHDAGVCHVFLDESAEPDMARDIVRDSKMRQMAVCNGLETLLVHSSAAATLLPHVLKPLHEEGVEVRGCARTCEIFGEAQAATEEDWPAEFLAPILAVKVVDTLDDAVAHVRQYGSDHTDVIVTQDYANTQSWLRKVNSSTVGVNCSTAFSDGFRLGLGAEIGISNSRIHAYGPMGLEGLTTRKFVLYGDGQLRE